MPKCLLCIKPYEIFWCSWKPLRLIYMFIDIGINASRICMPSIRFIYDKTHYIIIFHRLPQHHPSFPPNTTEDPASQKKKQQQEPKKCESSTWINNAYIDIILLSFTCARQSECRAHFTANKNVEDDDDDDDNNETCRLNTVKMIRQISISIEGSGKKVSKF